MDKCLHNILMDFPIDVNDEQVLVEPISHAVVDGSDFFLINQMDYIRQVLQNRNNIYRKEGPFVKYLKVFAKLGIATTEGDTWKRQRLSLRKAFAMPSLETMSARMTDVTIRYINELDQHVNADGIVDIHHQLMLLTLKIMGESLFSVELSHEQTEALLQAEKTANFTSSKLVNLSEDDKKASVLLRTEYEKAKKILDDFAYQTIENRRSSSDKPDDLLQVLLDAQQTEPEITDEEIRDQIISFFNGGHDTCGQNLTWACYMLSQHPDIAEQLHTDVTNAVGNGEFQLSDLEKMSWPLMVFKETLRLFPPAHVLTRVPSDEDVMGETTIPADSIVTISPWVTHRNKHYWPNPFVFDPTRFAKGTPPNPAFIPFGGGPRVCIGQGLAMREGQLILAALARTFRFSLPEKQRVSAYGALTLTPRFGLKLHIERV